MLTRYPPAAQQWRSSTALDVEDVRSAWNRNAEQWDACYDDDGDETRRYLSDEPLLAMVGDVTGLVVLDLGCGNGYLCRKLSRAGARMTGVDLSDRMLGNAESHERTEPLGIRYQQSSITELSFLRDETFDLVISNYVLQDVPEYAKAVHEAHRVLRPGSRFAAVITHPCFSCGPREWNVRAPDSPRAEEAVGFTVDRYFCEETYLLGGWQGFSPVPYFHRPLREYWRTFRASGFTVTDFDEPTHNARGHAKLPAWQIRQAERVPPACVFLLTKPLPSDRTPT